MYLREDYSIVLYYNLMNGLKQEAGKLNPSVTPFNLEHKLELLKKLGVTRIKKLPVGSINLTLIDINTALKKIVGFRNTRGEIGRYLMRYKERYYDDLRAGKHAGLVGKQRGFEFGDSVRCGPAVDDGGLTSPERISYFTQDRK